MEDLQKEEPHKRHQVKEVANEFACQRIIRQWTSDRDIPSSQAIPLLHIQLMKDIESYHKKGMTPIPPGTYRKSDLEVEEEPENFFVSGIDVAYLMSLYTKDLDKVLRELPRNPSGNINQIIKKAAWAYYTFERIHPFLDGNGRVGRMILKRIFKGAGLNDLLFHTEEGWKDERDPQLDALNAVDRSNNLDHLELFFLRQLSLRYRDGALRPEIGENIQRTERNISAQQRPYGIVDVWPGFKGVFIEEFKLAGVK